MRRKTYLTGEQQWERTVELACADANYRLKDCGLYNAYWLGRIVRPRLNFCLGDFAILVPSNGKCERQPVWCVTSKGYRIDNLYLGYRWYESSATNTTVLNPSRNAWGRKRKTINSRGIIQVLEIPENLVGVKPDSPALREFVLAFARKGCRTPGKRE
jgi:hypothetical protein